MRVAFYPLIVFPARNPMKQLICTTCRSKHSTGDLSYSPDPEKQGMEEIFVRVMLLAAMADGTVDQREIEVMQKESWKINGLLITPKEIERQIRILRRARIDLNTYLAQFQSTLTFKGRFKIIEICFRIMTASGELQSGQLEQLMTLRDTLGISDEMFREVVEKIN